MGNRGRYGKYGESKRRDRLREARIRPPFSDRRDTKPFKRASSLKKSVHQKAPLKIRLAKTSDGEFITFLSGKVFNIYGPYDDIVSEWFASGKTLTLIALLGKEPVGFAMMAHLSNETNLEHVTELLAIAVEPEKQWMGVGQMLMRHVERKAEELNVKMVFLHTAEENLPAQKLFTRNGYRPRGIRQHFYPSGQDAVVMSKEIGQRVR